MVGPVRSLRHYFAFLAADYGADMVHIGASPEGFAWRDAMNMGHLDESAGDPGVWRIAGAPAAAQRVHRYRRRPRLPARRAAASATGCGGRCASATQRRAAASRPSSLELGFRPWPYRVGYAWDRARERYLRVMEGAGAPRCRDRRADRAGHRGCAVRRRRGDPRRSETAPGRRPGRRQRRPASSSAAAPAAAGRWSKGGARTRRAGSTTAASRWCIPPGPVWVEVVPLGSPIDVQLRRRGRSPRVRKPL